MTSLSHFFIPLCFALLAALYSPPQPAEGPQDEQAVLLSRDEGSSQDQVRIPALLVAVVAPTDRNFSSIVPPLTSLPEPIRLVEQRSLSPPSA